MCIGNTSVAVFEGWYLNIMFARGLYQKKFLIDNLGVQLRNTDAG